MPTESSPNTGQLSLAFETCETPAHTTSPGAMSSPAASLAKTSVTPACVSASAGRDLDFGASLPESFASYDPATSSWKTSQLSLTGELALYSATWPRSGTMRNGHCYRRALWVRHTHGSGCSSWATPLASEGDGGGSRAMGERAALGKRRRSGAKVFARLRDQVRYRDTDGPLNPAWVEWLMGFPVGWADLEDSGTP